MVLIVVPAKGPRQDPDAAVGVASEPQPTASPDLCVLCLEPNPISGTCDVLRLPGSGLPVESKVARWERDRCPSELRKPTGVSVVFDFPGRSGSREGGGEGGEKLPLCEPCLALVSEMDKLEGELDMLFVKFWALVAHGREVKFGRRGPPIVRLGRDVEGDPLSVDGASAAPVLRRKKNGRRSAAVAAAELISVVTEVESLDEDLPFPVEDDAWNDPAGSSSRVGSVSDFREGNGSGSSRTPTRGSRKSKDVTCGACKKTFSSVKSMKEHQRARCVFRRALSGIGSVRQKKNDVVVDVDLNVVKMEIEPKVENLSSPETFEEPSGGETSRIDPDVGLEARSVSGIEDAEGVQETSSGGNKTTPSKTVQCEWCSNWYLNAKSLKEHQKDRCKAFRWAGIIAARIEQSAAGNVEAVSAADPGHDVETTSGPEETSSSANPLGVVNDDVEDEDDWPIAPGEKETGWKCDDCGASLRRKDSLVRHIKQSCPVLRFGFARPKVPGEAKEAGGSSAPAFRPAPPRSAREKDRGFLKCGDCGGSFRQKRSLNRHRKRNCPFIRLGPAAAAKPTVKKREKDEASSVSADKPDPPQDKAKDGSCLCEACGTSFGEKSSLKRHKKLSCVVLNGGSAESRVRCDICGEKFAKQSHLGSHRRFVHGVGKRTADNGDGLLACALCGQGFGFVRDRDEHEKTAHAADLIHACPECDKKFLTEKKLHAHKQIHKEYICTICGMQFKSRQGHFIHTRKHGPKRECKCEVCGEVFEQDVCLNKLARHQWKAHGMRKHRFEYPCSVCNLVLESKRGMQMHKYSKHGIREEGLKIFECDRCGKSFAKKRVLDAHLRIHDNIKLHACPHPGCDYRAVIFRSVKTHMGNVHKRNVKRVFRHEGARVETDYTIVDIDEPFDEAACGDGEMSE